MKSHSVDNLQKNIFPLYVESFQKTTKTSYGGITILTLGQI